MVDKRIAEFQQPERKEYASLYCLKALGSFLVVCIHSKFYLDIYFLEPILRIAIPIFFFISAFFIYDKDEEKRTQNLKKRFRKILWLTLYANIFYYIALCFPNDLMPLKSGYEVVLCIFLGFPYSFHLWFLIAYLEIIIMILLAQKYRCLKFLWVLMVIFFIVGLFFGKYNFLTPQIGNTLFKTTNCLTLGLPCFAVGWFVKKYQDRLLKVIKYPLLFFVLILTLSLLEWHLISGFYGGKHIEGALLITTLPLVFFLMLLGVKYPDFGKGSLFYVIGKKYSLGIYVYHILIVNLISNFISMYDIVIANWIVPLICFVLTITFDNVWNFLSRRVIMGRLKNA